MGKKKLVDKDNQVDLQTGLGRSDQTDRPTRRTEQFDINSNQNVQSQRPTSVTTHITSDSGSELDMTEVTRTLCEEMVEAVTPTPPTEQGRRQFSSTHSPMRTHM